LIKIESFAVHRYAQANVILSMRVMLNQDVDDAFVEMTKAVPDFEQTHLIVNFYYPQLKANFDQFSKVLNEAILTSDGSLNTSDPEFKQKFPRLVEECLSFEQAIIATSQSEFAFPG
jgi:hypothetical protein